jgi:uncharacterized protein (TIGR02391 family)
LEQILRLVDLVPDPEVVLAMSEQELGWVVLRLAHANQQHGKIHPTVLHRLGVPDVGQAGASYPAALRPALEGAVAEAVNWLTVQGLLIPEPENNNHMHFSRRALKLLRDGSFQDYARALAFPKALLHPKIAEEVWLDLARGDLSTAVFRAFRAVEVAVRDAGGYSDSDIGVPLMRKAFGAEGPLAARGRIPAEVDALANLFAGAIGSYKNPHSHRTVDITDPAEAQEMVVLASHMLRIVDSRVRGAKQ